MKRQYCLCASTENGLVYWTDRGWNSPGPLAHLHVRRFGSRSEAKCRLRKSPHPEGCEFVAKVYW